MGKSKSQRITTLVKSVIESGPERLCYSPEVERAKNELSAFMFENVYRNPVCKSEESKAKLMIEKLYIYFTERPEKLPEEYLRLADKFDADSAVCDYIAGMTDGYCTNLFLDIFVPKGWEL